MLANPFYLVIVALAACSAAVSQRARTPAMPQNYALIVTGDDVLTMRFANELRKGAGRFQSVGINELTREDVVLNVTSNLVPVLKDNIKYARYVVQVQSYDRRRILQEIEGLCNYNSIEPCAANVLSEASRVGLSP